MSKRPKQSIEGFKKALFTHGHIFISYSTPDRPRAKMLASALEGEGCTVWWDRQIPVGKAYDEIIEEKLSVE